MIAYLGTKVDKASHGLAIALKDASDGTVQGDIADANAIIWAEYHKINGDDGGWRLPSEDDFKYMFQACGGDTYKTGVDIDFEFGNFTEMIENVGGASLVGNTPSVYWTSTKDDDYHGYVYNFSNKKFSRESIGYYGHVRACLAF